MILYTASGKVASPDDILKAAEDVKRRKELKERYEDFARASEVYVQWLGPDRVLRSIAIDRAHIESAVLTQMEADYA